MLAGGALAVVRPPRIRYALIGTGRDSPTEEEAEALGLDAERLPLFG